MRISKSRVAKIRAKFGGKHIGFRQTDGSIKYISRGRLEDTFRDVASLRDTPATKALLCAESATDDSRIHQLIQALFRTAYICPKPIVKGIQ